jgi:hypothetical protein
MLPTILSGVELLAVTPRIPVDVVRKYWPVLLGAIAVMIVVALLKVKFSKPRTTGSGTAKPADVGKGWRVGHMGRDQMFYEEFRNGAWHRIEISGEMLTGRAHHVIYFGAIRFPEWAVAHRGEIITRIKSEFRLPDHEYDER